MASLTLDDLSRWRRAIADHVREVVPWANVEEGLRRALGGGS